MEAASYRFVETACPLCQAGTPARLLYNASFRTEDLSVSTFSARRMPDRVHYRMVRCTGCGLVRASPVLEDAALARLYAGSRFEYGDLSHYAAMTYRRCLQRAQRSLLRSRRLLEIGCGNGFFLPHALDCGFEEVYGVEPSADAVAAPPPGVRERITQAMFRPGLYPPEHFSCICSFQVLDHFAHPDEVVAECLRLLEPGGVALCVCHDIGSPLARSLGERSPMVDIEHVHLFDRSTVRRLFERNGFAVHETFCVNNRYPLAYWVSLAPVGKTLKRAAARLLRSLGLAHKALTLSAGNLGIIAAKPARGSS